MTNGDFVIYRFKDPAIHTNEDNAQSKIEFDGDAAIPDNTGSIESASYKGKRRVADIQNAFDDSKSQDTGNAGFFVTINAIVDEAIAESLIIDVLGDWDAEGTESELMPSGELGLRNNKRSKFNLKPSTDSAYKMVDVQIDDDERNGHLVPITIILQHSGDQTKLGSQV